MIYLYFFCLITGPVNPDYFSAENPHWLSKLFEVSEILVLEETDASLLMDIANLIRVDGQLIIHDFQQQRFLRFSDKGKYLGDMGSKGEGPGEFRHATAMSLNPAGDIAILDYRTSKILVFSPQGQFQREFSFRDQGFMASISSFSWTEDGRILLTDTSSAAQEVPRHLVVSDEGELIGGFGLRPWRRNRCPNVSHTGMARINGFWWSGSPLESQVRVYNDHFKEVTVYPTGVPGMSLETWSEFDCENGNVAKLFFEKPGIRQIAQVENLVFVQMWLDTVVMDLDGRVLAAGLQNDGVNFMIVQDNFVYTPRLDHTDENGQTPWSEKLNALRKEGRVNENPVIVVWKLKPK